MSRDLPPIIDGSEFSFNERPEIVAEKVDLDARFPQSAVDEFDAKSKARAIIRAAKWPDGAMYRGGDP